MKYQGQCHCGAVRFTVESDPITSGLRCNCSICRRRNAIMSSVYFEPAAFELLTDDGALARYQWGDQMGTSYFCHRCGIYTFHDALETPGQYRINLGCLEDLNLEELSIRRFDGADTWQFLD